MSNEINNLYEFGAFRFDTGTNTLWRDNELVSLSPKALELLRVIVERRGEIISKQAIFETVWQGTFVEEGVLTQNIYTLRKTLGTDENGNQIIENIARRGYRLNVPVNFAPKTEVDHDKQVLSVILSEQEILDEVSNKNFAAQKPFYRRKLFLVPAVAVVLLALGLAFGYRTLRRQIWAYYHPPLENVQLQKVTDSGRTAHPALSPDGNFMAYVRENAVFLKDLSSGKEIKLEISGAEGFGSLQFSPDGGSIYFRNSETLRKNANILQVSRFGGETRLVAEKTWGNFGLSPDRRKIAFVRKFLDSRKQDLIVKNLENGEEKTIASRDYPDLFYHRGGLAWSPDSARIAFVANAGTERSTRLFVVDANSGREEEIKSPRLRAFEQAVWTTDGETLIVSASETRRKSHLWKILYPSGDIQRMTNGLNNFGGLSISADGKKLLAVEIAESSNLWVAGEKDLTAQKQITTGNANNLGQTSLAWMDNEKIVCAEESEVVSNLYAPAEEANVFSNLRLLNAVTGERRPLTANTNFHSDFAVVSADGQAVYFNANRNRLINIWRMDANGENLTRITDATDGLQLYPQIAPDGRSLYYLFRNREAAVIKRRNLASGAEETFFESQSVIPAGFLALSPDGKHLAFLNLNGDTDTEGEDNNFQFAVVSTENANEIRFFNVKANGSLARFSPDGKFLDYVSYSPLQSKILRQSLDGGEPTEIFNLPKERIFNFAWSKDGMKLAVSRGHQYRDAVLLTGFE
jgi:Tol biopolymer transport system component/DNA-binding winged helix-turn-helix (wHTH) protein